MKNLTAVGASAVIGGFGFGRTEILVPRVDEFPLGFSPFQQISRHGENGTDVDESVDLTLEAIATLKSQFGTGHSSIQQRENAVLRHTEGRSVLTKHQASSRKVETNVSVSRVARHPENEALYYTLSLNTTVSESGRRTIYLGRADHYTFDGHLIGQVFQLELPDLEERAPELAALLQSGSLSFIDDRAVPHPTWSRDAQVHKQGAMHMVNARVYDQQALVPAGTGRFSVDLSYAAIHALIDQGRYPTMVAVNPPGIIIPSQLVFYLGSSLIVSPHP